MEQAGRLRITVDRGEIKLWLQGTAMRASYRKGQAPWLVLTEHGDDPDADMPLTEFRALSWAIANEKARELGWIV
jgi:hypothetical protein